MGHHSRRPVAVAAAGAAPAPEARRRRRGADRVRRRADRRRRQEDPGDQGRPRDHRPRPQGGEDLVDGAPSAVKEGVTQEEADSIKAQLEEAGASVEIK